MTVLFLAFSLACEFLPIDRAAPAASSSPADPAVWHRRPAPPLPIHRVVLPASSSPADPAARRRRPAPPPPIPPHGAASLLLPRRSRRAAPPAYSYRKAAIKNHPDKGGDPKKVNGASPTFLSTLVTESMRWDRGTSLKSTMRCKQQPYVPLHISRTPSRRVAVGRRSAAGAQGGGGGGWQQCVTPKITKGGTFTQAREYAKTITKDGCFQITKGGTFTQAREYAKTITKDGCFQITFEQNDIVTIYASKGEVPFVRSRWQWKSRSARRY